MTASAHPPCSGSLSILSGSAPVPNAQSGSACFSGPFCTHHSSSHLRLLSAWIPVLPSSSNPQPQVKHPPPYSPLPPPLSHPAAGKETRYSDTSGLVVFSQVIHRITSRKTEQARVSWMYQIQVILSKGPGSAHEAKITSGQVKSGHSRPSTKDAPNQQASLIKAT